VSCLRWLIIDAAEPLFFAMDQELFKCKPAIMRAFQAAKGAHKVIAEAAAFSRVLGSACIAER
jgi:hypothetical protein